MQSSNSMIYSCNLVDHQRGRIITHSSQSMPGLEMVKQEHCVGDVVGELN